MSRHTCGSSDPRGADAVLALWFVSVLVLVPARMATAEPSATLPLGLEAAVSMARQNSQLVRAARLRIGEAEGDLTGASILLVNNLDLAVSAGPRTSGLVEDVQTTDFEIGVGQRFEIGGQRAHRIKRARAELEAARAVSADVERVIDLAIARTFYAALADEARLELLNQNEGLAKELYDIARRRLEAGEGTPLELNTARIRLAEAQRRTMAAHTRLQAATVRLAELLGLPPDTRLDPQGDLPRGEETSRVDALVTRALQFRPDLAGATHNVEASAAAIELAEAETWPDPELGVSYSEEEGDRILMVGLRVPLPFFNRNQGERERALATRDRRAAERDALRLSIESELLQALLVYDQARRALRLYDAEVLAAQSESLDLLQRALEAGEVGLADVIVVQREVIEGREGYLDVRLALAQARAAALAAASLPQTATLRGEKP